MKLIIAIIQPSKLESVKAALTEVEVFRLTVMDVQGFGRQKGHAELYRGPRNQRQSAPQGATANCRERRFRRAHDQRHHQRGPHRPERAKSATARSSSCRWKIASASAPANAAAKRFRPPFADRPCRRRILSPTSGWHALSPRRASRPSTRASRPLLAKHHAGFRGAPFATHPRGAARDRPNAR